MIKILHLIDHLGIGGAQEIIFNICSHRSDTFQHEVLYFFNKNIYEEDFKKIGVSVHSLNLGNYTYRNVVCNLLNPLRYVQLFMYLRKRNFDVMHIHLFFSYFIGALIGRLHRNRAIIYTMHAMRNQMPRFYKIAPFFSPLIDVYIADADACAKEMIGSGIPMGKVTTITIATPYHTRGSSRPESVRQEFGIGMSDPIVLNVARLQRQKGHQYLLRAFKQVVEQIPNAHLIIVGSGEEENILKKLISEIGLTRNVHLAGYRKNLIDFYDSCSIYCSTSVYEAMGIAILDALARKKPVVAFKVGAVDKVVIPNITGLLIAPYDADGLARGFIRLINDSETRRLMGERAFSMIRDNYSLDSFLNKYKRVYMEVFDSRKPG